MVQAPFAKPAPFFDPDSTAFDTTGQQTDAAQNSFLKALLHYAIF